MRTTCSCKLSLIWHSQIVNSDQPPSSNCCFLNLSRSIFLTNFSAQKSEFVFGSFNLQYGHLCQKQPLTNIANLRFVKAMSGLPGIPFRCSLYPLIPTFQSAFLNNSSGLVCLALFALIIREVLSFCGIGARPSLRYCSMILQLKNPPIALRANTFPER